MSYLTIKRSLLVTLGVMAFATAGVLAGCSGGDTESDGNPDAGPADGYVSDGGSGATLTIRLNDNGEDITVADTKGFFVEARDPRGQPLSFIRIFCESERGIAIIEPSANGVAFEHTGPDGSMSGVLGGVFPGSFMLECRAPEGFGLVARARLKVRGSVPAGFGGFPGAAGGNLGGGVIVNDNISGSAQLLAVTFTDAGGESVSGPVDTNFDTDCDGAVDTVDPEPFTDTSFAVTIRNPLGQAIVVDSVQFNLEGLGSTPELGVTTTIAAGSEGDVTGLLIVAPGGGATGQHLVGTDISLTNANDTYPTTVTVRGHTLAGDDFTISAEVTLTVRGVNNC